MRAGRVGEGEGLCEVQEGRVSYDDAAFAPRADGFLPAAGTVRQRIRRSIGHSISERAFCSARTRNSSDLL